MLMVVQPSESFRISARLAGVALFLFVGGCGSLDFEAKESREIEVSLPPAMLVRCETHNGDVRLGRGAAGRVTGAAHVTARGSSDAEARDVLQRATVISEVIDDRLVMRIEGPKFASFDVAFDLTVPEGTPIEVATHNGDVAIDKTRAAVKVSSHNGRIALDDVGPLVEIATHNGDVELSLASLEPDCRVDSHNATVTIRLDPRTSATVEASTHNGKLAVQAADGTYSSGSPLRQVLGEGKGRIRVSNHNGDACIDLRSR